MPWHRMESAPRKLTALQTMIDGLGSNEHGVILDMVQRGGVQCAKNTNGYFFDLTTVDQGLLDDLERFVTFSVDNNHSLAAHDRCMHDQLKLLQRIPAAQIHGSAPHAVPSPRRARAAAVAAPSPQEPAQRGARLAFVRRAGDTPARKRTEEDVVETPDEPLYLNGRRRDF